jgi:hypothetical protein
MCKIDQDCANFSDFAAFKHALRLHPFSLCNTVFCQLAATTGGFPISNLPKVHSQASCNYHKSDDNRTFARTWAFYDTTRSLWVLIFTVEKFSRLWPWRTIQPSWQMSHVGRQILRLCWAPDPAMEGARLVMLSPMIPMGMTGRSWFAGDLGYARISTWIYPAVNDHQFSIVFTCFHLLALWNLCSQLLSESEQKTSAKIRKDLKRHCHEVVATQVRHD